MVGENNTGKTRLLDYIFNQNEEWDKLNEEYKDGSPKSLPIFFRSFGKHFPVYGLNSKYSSKEEKGEIKCFYELYYFDLKSNIPSLIKKEEKLDEGIEFENVKERSCVVYYTENNLEKDTEKLKSVVIKEVRETKKSEPLILKYKDKKRNFVLDIIHGVRGHNSGMEVSHSWLEVGSGLLKYNGLKSLIKQILKKYKNKNKNTEIDKAIPPRYSGMEIRVPILLIEEPELLLHPSLAIGVVNLVRKLADNNIATIMTTHSPSFLSHFVHNDKLNLIIIRKDETGNLFHPLYFWNLVNTDKIKNEIMEEYKEFARPNEEIEDFDEFYESKWKRLLNKHTLKIFFNKNVLFVEGMAEYILLNNILRETLEEEFNDDEEEFNDIEIVPMFGKFHYIFFDKLAKRLNLNYWFLLDDDRRIDKEGKQEWFGKQKLFWEKYGKDETNEETNGIIHSKEESRFRISWFSSDVEKFLGVELSHYEEVHKCCKEYNIISRAKDILKNLEREQEKIKESLNNV